MILRYTREERDGKKPPVPYYATAGAAGLDLSAFGCDYTVKPLSHALIPTGLHVQIPEGYVGLIIVRSSLGIKRKTMLSNNVGVIDSDYRGELIVSVYNTAQSDCVIRDGERIAQLVVVPCAQFLLKEEELDTSERNEGRFGSTG